jgi:hypothetical protein
MMPPLRPTADCQRLQRLLQIVNVHDQLGLTIAWVSLQKADAGSRIRAKELYLHCIIVEQVV